MPETTFNTDKTTRIYFWNQGGKIIYYMYIAISIAVAIVRRLFLQPLVKSNINNLSFLAIATYNLLAPQPFADTN